MIKTSGFEKVEHEEKHIHRAEGSIHQRVKGLMIACFHN